MTAVIFGRRTKTSHDGAGSLSSGSLGGLGGAGSLSSGSLGGLGGAGSLSSGSLGVVVALLLYLRALFAQNATPVH